MRRATCARPGCYGQVFADGECRLHILEMMDLDSDWTPLNAPPDSDDPGPTFLECREKNPARRCDACAAIAQWVIEISRVKDVAVFRLCTKHADNVRRTDPKAFIHQIRSSNG